MCSPLQGQKRRGAESHVGGREDNRALQQPSTTCIIEAYMALGPHTRTPEIY